MVGVDSRAKVDSGSAETLGLNPSKFVSGAYVGIVRLKDVRPYEREDVRLQGSRVDPEFWRCLRDCDEGSFSDYVRTKARLKAPEDHKEV